MNTDIELLKLLLKYNLIKPDIKFKQYIKNDVITSELKKLIHDYFNEKNTEIEDVKKAVKEVKLSYIKKELKKNHQGISSNHFYYTRRQHCNVITLYRKLPDKRINDIRQALKAGENEIDFTFIKKRSDLFSLITPQDVQRYGFCFSLKESANEEDVKRNLQRFKELRDSLGIVDYNKKGKESFLVNFCLLYDDISSNTFTDQQLLEKIKSLLL